MISSRGRTRLHLTSFDALWCRILSLEFFQCHFHNTTQHGRSGSTAEPAIHVVAALPRSFTLNKRHTLLEWRRRTQSCAFGLLQISTTPSKLRLSLRNMKPAPDAPFRLLLSSRRSLSTTPRLRSPLMPHPHSGYSELAQDYRALNLCCRPLKLSSWRVY